MMTVVIPVYNEQQTIVQLCDRLRPVLISIGAPFEIILVNDGSRDDTLTYMVQLYESYPDIIRIIDLKNNVGQHMAIMAGFAHVRGDTVITIDADLQNPPEEIPKLLSYYQDGHDYVGSIRLKRQDNFFRTYASKLANKIRCAISNIDMIDHGCMLRIYKRSLVDAIVACNEKTAYVPVTAYQLATNPIEIYIRHEARCSGFSKYNLYKLLRLNFDLMTNFSVVPLQLFTLFGVITSFFSGILVFYLLIRRFIYGPEAEGVFTLFAIVFFLISVLMSGVGILGEYVGRIYQAVNQRPRYVVRKIIEKEPKK
jgi:undecaprenyl-phosphate 4-deoxy-4-formamido-L-arabinose transferase